MRWLLGFLLLLLIGWLIFDTSPAEAKWKAIEEELKRGTIGKLSLEESDLLQQTLTWIIPQAGIKGPIIINNKPQPGHLHVYVTTPDAMSSTGCARGNAIYNAELDAIFIDQQILYPKEIPMLGEKSPNALLSLKDFTFVPVYLRFILLHELGHRQLHRRSSGFFDVGSSSRKAEKEADNFAVNTLKKAYQADLSTGGHLVGEGAAEFIQMEDSNLSVSERVWVDLVSSVANMSQALMFSDSDFSSFYEDTAHPNFIKRAMDILDAAVAAPENSSALKAHAAIYRRNLDRMQHLAQSDYAEIQLTEGVQKVTFDAEHLLSMTNRGHIFSVSLDEVQKAISAKNHTVRRQRPTINGPYQSVDEDEAYHSEMWVHPKSGPIIIRPDYKTFEVNAVTIQNNQFIASPTLTRQLRKDGYRAEAYTSPQPATVALLKSVVAQNEQFIIVRNGLVTNRIRTATIKQACAKRFNLVSVNIEVGTVTDSLAYLTIFDGQGIPEHIVGVAQLDLYAGKIRSLNPLLFRDKEGYEMPSIANDKLVVVPRNGEPLYVLLTRNRIHFIASILSTTRPIEPLSDQPFLFDSVLTERHKTGNIMGHFDPQLTSATLLPSGQILVIFANDSAYLLDVHTGKTAIVFSPGTAVQVSVSNQGFTAFFIPNGRKIYVIKPNPYF
ncbi:ImmA/IrrE family metallo-endopeptidase [Spirosoma endbachense]|uniref:Uncharacterized protein n=1 Tax=Spirosoma endbachense TaxID=2666025 RepID=A0A6P1W8Y7_9BACT|nr:hypothetical protein [Spirosoma endbachense]QHW01029.1 hypothetical protein GJR95_41030 [Spirosoma endbachense]